MKTVWVYVDEDHGDIEVFSEEKSARAYAEKQWPDCFDEEGWDGNQLGEYAFVVKKELRK